MIAVAARVLGCNRQTIYTAKKRDPQISDVLDGERELFVDTAELKLIDAVSRGESWAITLTLKTLGRHRGYVERVEQHHLGGKTLAELIMETSAPAEALGPNGENGRTIPRGVRGTA